MTEFNPPSTSSVTYLKQSVDKDFVGKLFSKFAIKYGKLWTERMGPNPDWVGCLIDWVEELSKFSLGQATVALNKCFSIYREFPPTQPQFIDLCLKETGLPEQSEIIRLMVAKDFSHPLVKMVYDKIGNWDLSNSKDYEIREKVKNIYPGCLADFQIDPKTQWQKLTAFLDEPKQLPPPDKIPSTKESAAFKECMAKCQEILKGKGVEPKTYRQFEEEKISPSNNAFDQKVYDEFREYLLSIPETETMTLPPNFAYRRMKLIAAKEQPDFLRKAGYDPNPQGTDKTPPRGSGGPRRVYTNYGGD